MSGAACKGFLFKKKCKCNRGLIPAANKRSCVAPPPPTCGPGKTLNSQKKCVQGMIKLNSHTIYHNNQILGCSVWSCILNAPASLASLIIFIHVYCDSHRVRGIVELLCYYIVDSGFELYSRASAHQHNKYNKVKHLMWNAVYFIGDNAGVMRRQLHIEHYKYINVYPVHYITEQVSKSFFFGFTWSESNSYTSSCTAEIGSNCQAPSSAKACEGMNGAGCRGGKCQCNGHLVPAPNKRSCMPPPPPICGPGKTLYYHEKCVQGR